MAQEKKKLMSEELSYNRRYVGSKETVAYLFNDFSNAFHIDGYKNRFIWDVVKIDFQVQAIMGLFTGAWDVVNDMIIGVLVDKTRTRWGKFRPYLVTFQMPMLILGMFYWFMPVFFPQTAATYIPKLIYYFAFEIIRETAGTFTSIAKTGYMTTITPNPDERGRLILLAELLTGYMGEDLPGVLMGLFIDLVNSKTVNWKLGNVFITMGMVTSVISTVCTLFFFIVSRERVMQTVEKPNLRQGFKAILNNKPILMIMLSKLFEGFKISTDQSDYFIDVLGYASLQTIINLPSSMNGSISYAFVQPLRRRFSSKALWVFEDIYSRLLLVIVFMLGSPNKNYQRRLFMSIVFGAQAWFDKWAFGVRKVINADLYNEAMDYCEWTNGYRVEATTTVVYNLIIKVQSVIMGSVRNMILKGIGYEQGRVIGTQDDRTKWWMFAMCTGIPALTGALSIVPRCFYPLSREKRIQMYNELHERRSNIARTVNEGEEVPFEADL